jgi:N-acetyl-anhydromuramyl-L-alanine amidase AmpD
MGREPKWIILHGTAGGGSVEWLTNPESQVSAHYVIKGDGTIYQLVDEEAAAWANGILSSGHDEWWSNEVNPNLETISIEHEKLDQTNNVPLTPAQALASFQLVSRICQRWKIPARKADASGGITGHSSIDTVSRSRCPGTYPWENLFQFLGKVQRP